MSLYISDFLDGRIEEVAQNLHKTNTEYALSMKKISQLMENINPIVMSTNEELTISHSDCLDFKEYMHEEFICTAIMQQTLYWQGYLDCVKLLRMLGVLS